MKAKEAKQRELGQSGNGDGDTSRTLEVGSGGPLELGISFKLRHRQGQSETTLTQGTTPMQRKRSCIV